MCVFFFLLFIALYLGLAVGKKACVHKLPIHQTPSFQSLSSIHYYRVSHRHQNKRMNTIKRAVIAQGMFFLKRNKKQTYIHSYTLTSHIPHSSHIYISNKKEKQDKKLTHKDKTGHDKRGQDKTRHPSVQLTF